MGTPPSSRDPLVAPSFGSLVRRRRRVLDLTQAALARRVGCATATVKKIEHDERRPSPIMAERFADALGIPAAQRAAFIAVGTGDLAPARYVDRAGPSAVPAPPVDVVGRDHELAVLGRHLRAVLEDGARLVFVTGEAGHGKTALLTAFARTALVDHADLVVARGVGTAANGVGDPYLLFRDAFAELTGEDVGRRDDLSGLQHERVQAFAPFVAAATVRLGRQLADLLLPTTTHGNADAPPSGPVPSRDQMMGQAATVLRTLAEQRPLVLAFDDLQWADPASLELLFHLTRRLGDAPILLVGAYRASEVAVGSSPSTTTLRRLVLEAQAAAEDAVVDLAALDPGAARRLCDALLDRDANRLGEEVRTALFRRTRGHPLFVVELLRELQDRGDLVRDEDGALVPAGELDWDRLPSRIVAVVAQRLDRLDEDERALLDIAAVEGDRFTAEVVATVSGMDVLDVCRTLDRRIGHVHGLVRVVGSERVDGRSLSTYRFDHILFQQGLLDAMGEGARRHLHRRVGAALEDLHRAVPDHVATRLAHHFEAADEPERAVVWHLRAGDRARAVYAHDEAVLHYRKAADALRAAGDPERLARVLMKLGLTHQIAFDHAAAQDAYDEAFRLWRVVPTGDADASRATLRMVWGDPPSLDPTVGGYNATAPITTQLLAGLVRWGEDNEILPDVAHSWTFEDDGRRIVFHLRDDVHWHDGLPVTAHDFVATYRRAVDPATGAPIAPSLLEPVVGARRFRAGELGDERELGIHAPDATTLVISLDQPTSWFLPNLAYYVLLPTPTHVVEEHGARWAEPATFVGNGPFRLASWERHRSMVLTRNPTYHGAATGNVGRIELDLTLPDDQVAAAYDRDELDVVTTFRTPAHEVARIRRRHPLDHHRQQAFISWVLAPDLARTPVDDPAVRRALSLAIDREAFVREAKEGLAVPASGGVVPEGMPGYCAAVGTAFDPVAAQRLLAGADGRGDQEVVLAVSENARTAGRFLERAWTDVGVQVRLEVVPAAQLLQVGAHVVFGGWMADYPDPDTFLRVFLGPAGTPGWPARYLDLLDEAGGVIDQPRRLTLYEEAERIIARDTLVIPVIYEHWHVLQKPWVTNFRVPAVKHPGFWHDLRVGPVTDPGPRYSGSGGSPPS